MVPTFKMHGSKARTAPWIIAKFPTFRRLLEPFAGKGNIFYRACSECNFESALLNDVNSWPFLEALRDYSGDWGFVDDGVIDKDVWLRWKDSPQSHERALAESYVARFGSSYDIGPALAGGDSKNGHSRSNTIRRMQEAQRLFREKHVQITRLDWKEFLDSLVLSPDDLVYLDPPYDVPQNVHYKNIDQDKFLAKVKALPCSVFVSGYTSPRYERELSGPGWERDVHVRASTGKGVAAKGQSGSKPRVEEVLWWKISPETPRTIEAWDFFRGV